MQLDSESKSPNEPEVGSAPKEEAKPTDDAKADADEAKPEGAKAAADEAKPAADEAKVDEAKPAEANAASGDVKADAAKPEGDAKASSEDARADADKAKPEGDAKASSEGSSSDEDESPAKGAVAAAARAASKHDDGKGGGGKARHGDSGEKVSAPPFALMGYFTTPADIYHACEALRDAGYSRFDAHTPFPVHGLEKAMGLKPSVLPFLVLGGGTTGLIGGLLLAWYTQALDYPLDISGKPPFALPAFVPILFELTILLSALTCFFGLWGLTRLPTFFHPTMTHPSFHRASDDVFFVSVEASDPKFDTKETRRLLERLGAQDIAEVAS